MKALITASGQYGPFTSITQGSDRWVCDDCEFQFSVIGDASIGKYTPPPAPPAPPAAVPQSVTMRQARLALLAAGQLEAVAPAIASMPSPAKEQAGIEWEYSTTVERNRPLVLTLGPALGLDAAALDALFVAAAAL